MTTAHVAAASHSPSHGHHHGHDHSHAAGHGHGDHHDLGMGHPVELWKLFTVFFILIALTILTVTASNNANMLGSWEIWVSMGIATVKALLVAVYFMHLRHDKPLNILFISFTLFFMFLFLIFSWVDTTSYASEIEAQINATR